MDGQKTHCMLQCKAPSNICPGTSKCLVVEFDTSDSKKAGICAPKPQDGKCSADDHPEGSTALPKSIKDDFGTHCELDCSADQTCPGESKCASVKTFKSQ